MRPAPRPRTPTAPLRFEYVVVVRDRQETLAGGVRRLHRVLKATVPAPWRILIVDDASADATLAVARRLASELPEVDVVHDPTPGHADATARAAAHADVVCRVDPEALDALARAPA